MKPLKLAILISGRGTNMQAIIDACNDPAFPATIAAVITNNPDSEGINIADDQGLETATLNHKQYPTRELFDEALHKTIEASGANFVCLAGFMRLLTPSFVEKWLGRIINIHPSLLPDFKGAHAHRDVIAAGVDKSGCTVHFVVPEMDSGPIILQESVPVLPGDTESALAARVLQKEHVIYPKAIEMIAKGEVSY